MSTKTTFKRIALVAVAALGLGVMSVVPSQATVSGLTVTGVNGTSTLSASSYVSDSTTAATVSVAGLLDTAFDTVTVTFIAKSVPAGSAATAYSYFMESTTPSSATRVDTATGTTAWSANTPAAASATLPLTDGSAKVLGTAFRMTHATTGYVGATFAVQLDSATARIAGTYTYTAIVKAYNAGTVAAASTLLQDVSIVIGASAVTTDLAAGTIAPASSTAYLNEGTSYTTASDSAIAVVATAGSTVVGVIRVRTYSAAGNPAPESVTATVTGAGLIGNGGVYGKSIALVGTGGDSTFSIIADGTAGVSSIVIKTTSVTFPTKTLTFYAAAASTATGSLNKPAIAIGTTTDVVRAVLTDANGTVWGGAAYIYAAAAADALVAGSATVPAACTYVAAYGYHACPVTAIAAGTASLKVIDASTVALATATSASVVVKVSAGTPTTAKIAFDKATYAPGEKATVTVSILDAAGNIVPAQTVTSALTATGVTASTTVTGTLPGANIVVEGATSAALATTAGAQQYTIYMPTATGDVTLSATGSTGLALSGRVAITATASVVNSSVDAATDAANEATDAANAATDAALAAADSADAATEAAQEASDAVAELSTQVAALMASLKAQIKSLTNLVIKIQKKLK